MTHLWGENDIAIVGMAAHLPGAADIHAYWQNLRDGVSSIRRLSEEELRAAGEDPGLMRHRDYVPFAAPLEGFAQFDAEFYGLSPKDAAIMDPQHRQFLECAWEAMETAGHVPEGFDGQIGVFAGCGMGSYFYFNVCSNPDLVDNTGMFLLRHTGNDKDFMTTRLSHIMDLKGPSINLQTACSTSLVAVHYGVQALLNGECDMVLAGGVTIELPQGRGYLYKENEILSPDGACHAFDHRAKGTVFGSGAGCVVLRRMADAVADGDHIWGVIKGTAVNNDGAAKAGYLAPSVEGQAAAVAEAQAIAGVTSDTVDYVECHGTGTYLGDPIEVAALTEAFRETSGAVGHCRIGSVKTNIGHLDTAAGVASLIKASLALHHAQIPPSLGYEAPNPAIGFEGSPFMVNDRLTDWTRGDHPRRAGVNALGVGGTNAHVVLEEAPERAAGDASDWPFQILTVSGRSKAALEANAARLAAHLRAHPEQDLADVAWTLKDGRRAFERRMVVVADSHSEAADLLEGKNPRRLHLHSALERPEVVFMFPGGGAQYAGMARDLYETEPVFAEWMDRGLTHLEALMDASQMSISEAEKHKVRALWLPEDDVAAADAALLRPSLQLPLIMITEYALAQMWMGWGVMPAALTGHSMGENTAACLAGVMSFEDCIGLVHLRGRLFDTVPEGGMLSVSLSAADLRPLLGADLDLAAENGVELSVASGPQAALDQLEAVLAARGVDCQRIGINIAAHSRMLEPILAEFESYLRSIALHPPQIPLTSNRTGRMMTDAQAMDPAYWVGHLRGSVLFADCLSAVAGDDRVLLEVGPGKALSSLARAHPEVGAQAVLSSLRHRDEEIADDKHMFEVLGRLAALGVSIDWAQIWGDARRNRVVLPTYAFQRQEYFIAPGEAVSQRPTFLTRTDDVSGWGWKPVWRPRAAEVEVDVAHGLGDAAPQVWLMFEDEGGVAARLSTRLRAAGHQVVAVRPGDAFARVGEDYVLAPERGREGFDLLLADLGARGLLPTRIGHFWLLTEGEGHRPGSSFFHRVQEQGFYSLLFLAQALEGEGVARPLHIDVVTNGAVRLRDEGLPYPEKATVAGPARVIPREMPGVTVNCLDVVLPVSGDAPFWARGRTMAEAEAAREALDLRLLEELLAEPRDGQAALRGDRRFDRVMKPMPLEDAAPVQADVVLLTGGFGGIGLTLAQDLASRGTKLALLARQALPERAEWPDYLKRHAPQDRVAQRIRAVQSLEDAGAEVMVVAADVCNAGQMRTARDAVTARFGPISGVIHGAGVIDDAPLLAKSPASVESVFTPKIHGTDVLGEVFPDGTLDWMVLFASSSTVTAPAGQVDYVAANEYLNAYAQARSGKTRVVALNWGIWNEVGMAAEAVAARTGDLPDAPEEPVALPLLDVARFDAQGNRVFAASYSADDWWIDEHRTRAGDALLPGTGYLTLAAHALRAHHEDGPFELRDLSFLRPLKVADQGARQVEVTLTRTDSGYGFEVAADVSLNGRHGFAATAEGALSLLPMGTPEPVDLDALRARCGAAREAAGAPLVSAQEVHLNFGPRWKVLRRAALGQGEGVAELELGPEAADDGCLLHPALMDIATGWAMELIEGYQATHLWVPVRYASVKVYEALPARVVSWVRNAAENRADRETAVFDVTLCDLDGRVCVEVKGFTIRKLASLDVLRDAPRLTPAEVRFDEPSTAQALSPAEERLAHNLSQGILPAEGVTAFHRVLASGERQVVVSSMDLPALVAQAGAVEATATQNFERPQLESDFVAPEGEIEERLAGFWQELLGVSNVGVEDSFFDLGGHSLIAVRLFAMIKKAFRVDFPISVLFEAPTIRACAALIEAEIGPVDGAARAEAPQRRFRHLVAMHEGDGGPRQPFFLIAGMFGNVLNLRHLAHLLGADRPFYGVQARGLYGGETPHDSIEDAARDYIAEMRQVQPHGPYMLGGFSGGGITAYEIAHQLEAAGEQVSLVVMLDTPLPQRRPLELVDRVIIQAHKAREKGLLYPFVWARNRIAWEIAKRRAPGETEAAHGFHNAEIEAAFYRAINAYTVAPWDGRLVLFRPPLSGQWTVSGGKLVNSERTYVLEDNDWRSVAPQVEVHEVPGDHDSMVLEPNVRVLAGLMRDVIEDAERPMGDVVPFPSHAAE
ncbi:acyl transferase domain-containing protein/thioesterase domain-containing protein/acyl carrier protein [Sagittula marina]|uniref:Acyl transferase domain-containing protein/thioesterase domain-containing protein/acyl carrier protein n=1 Tax=Sagittula marina TaxID=943940 RepID=A0A7W6DIB7_9RHOB|nr:type I polyketide synthase [Sagittula marina]MBB3983830.1 acyl transferase domain-containing protein/thioesterase domain-containing protein/acyl carrier protein [Sagittula marina]